MKCIAPAPAVQAGLSIQLGCMERGGGWVHPKEQIELLIHAMGNNKLQDSLSSKQFIAMDGVDA